jgi:hypothetical protein
VAAHKLSAATSATKTAQAAAADSEAEPAGQVKCQQQPKHLPAGTHQSMIEDPQLRHDICRTVFDY